jgi:SAM-dependent methyltransferase
LRDTQHFYDRLAPYYHLIYPDWETSSKRQVEALDSVIREYFGDGARRVLDAACGIGTQSLGLAQRGYEVVASDISSAEIERAREEAVRRKVVIQFLTADMRQVHREVEGAFDILLACDNAVPHLLSDEDILEAFASFHKVLSPGGGAIISVRDYANMELGGVRINPRRVHREGEGKIILFDVWEFEGGYYDVSIYMLFDDGSGDPEVKVFRGGRYYCVSIDRLERLFLEAGFSKAFTLRNRFYQPLIVAVK